MASKDRILLVEGESDRAFFELICRKIGLNDGFVKAIRSRITGKSAELRNESP